MPSTSGSIFGNNVDGNEGSYLNWQLAGQDVGGNFSVINWQIGWRFATYSCRGLRNGYGWFNGGYVYYNFGSGDNIHGYNGGHDHRPAMHIAGSSLVIPHNADGTKDFTGQVTMGAFGTPTSYGIASWTLPPIPRNPNPPVGLGISDIRQKSVVFTWTGNPADGLPPDAYEVAYGTNPTTAETYITPVAPPYAVTGLVPGTHYYFWVRTHNAVGWGPWAGISEATTIAGARVNVGGVWYPAVPYVRQGGVWKVARPWVKNLGEWKETI